MKMRLKKSLERHWLSMQIYILKVPSEISIQLFSRLMEKISEERQEQINRLQFSKDKYLSLFSELIIRMHIQKMNLSPNAEIKFFRTEYGKLKVELDKMHFNVSHSGEYIACGIDNNEIGVDIEEVIPIDIEVSKLVFTKKEIAYINRDHNNSIDHFYQLWTLKESLIKALGLGFHAELKRLELVDVDLLSKYEEWYFKTIDVVEGYKLSICSKKNDSDFTIEFLDYEEVQKYFDSNENICINV